MTVELNYEGNSPLNGYVLLENIILPPDLYAKLRELAMSKAQSPDAMARLLIEQSLSLSRRSCIELLEGLPRRTSQTAPAPR